MPRTVNFSDNPDRRDKNNASDSSGDSRFFGLRLRLPQVLTKSESPAEPPVIPPTITPEQTPQASVVAVEAVPVESPSPAPAPVESVAAPEPLVTAVAFSDLVGDNGDVDFEQLFQQANLPTVPVNAERAWHILASIPKDIPFHVKRILVKTSLNMMSDLVPDTSVSTTIVTDAAQKMLWVARLQQSLTSEIKATRDTTQAEIARLEAEIIAQKERLAATEIAVDTSLRQCIQRMNQLHDVTVFFDTSEDGGNGPDRPSAIAQEPEYTDTEEVPAFQDDKSVMRLLGIPQSAVSDEKVGISASSHLSSSADNRNGFHRYNRRQRITNPST